MNDRLRRLATALAVSLVVASAPGIVRAERVEVTAELDRLASLHGFAVRGGEHTAGAFARVDPPELLPRLRRLLEAFDHVIVQSATGEVERVIILGEKDPTSAPPIVVTSGGAAGEIVLTSVRLGTQHAVQVALEGAEGARLDQLLLVDTGADFVVLPVSLIEALGLDSEDLGEREMQTANGLVTAKVGSLPGLWLGETRIEGIEVAFIDDDKLSGNGLLGMNVLGRYRLTIDDEHSQITLTAK
jgi:clan AA aspartic protease (TIGR02281 family)